jgi:hypothetical protein
MNYKKTIGFDLIRLNILKKRMSKGTVLTFLLVCFHGKGWWYCAVTMLKNPLLDDINWDLISLLPGR